MGFHDVAFLPYRASFSIIFAKNFGRGEGTSGATTGVETVIRVSSCMFTVKYFCTNKAPFCVCRILWRSSDYHKDEVNLATLCFGNATGFKTVVSVCLHAYRSRVGDGCYRWYPSTTCRRVVVAVDLPQTPEDDL